MISVAFEKLNITSGLESDEALGDLVSLPVKSSIGCEEYN